MTKPLVTITDGSPYPLGNNLTESGCNFAVHCPEGKKVWLCLFHPVTEAPATRIALPAKTGDIWHGHVAGIEPGQLYGYRVEGEFEPEQGLLFNPDKLLLDPYTRQISRKATWVAGQYTGDSHAMIPKSVVREQKVKADPARPAIPIDQTILYEAHVKGLTMLHPSVPEVHRGKFLGVCHPAVIKHLQELGVSSIQLLPVTSFMPEPFITDKGLTNYWGYNPLCFFAPDPRYGVVDPVAEFRQMVDTLHDAGIEVIMDVVYNHNAEGGGPGLVLSLKGFDNRNAFLFEPDQFGNKKYRNYINNSGCGNTLNTANPFMMKLVMDSLRYWVTEMGVDGFRFDLAASLGRDPYDFSSEAGMFRTIKQDPVLSQVKLIAEPWDIGMGGYRLGQFPAQWHECNDKFRDTVRGFWRADRGTMGDFATRIMGSRDVFPKNHRCGHASVNNITYHDGFTLHDLVSYNDRHNLDNLEDNRDGHGHNLSSNYGHEGPTTDIKINQLRERQKRNLFATLILSQGIPHILAGDELSRSQNGNNNAYCQDNPISWLDWTQTERKKDFLAFCQLVIKLRKSSVLASNMAEADDHYTNRANVKSIHWYRPDGEKQAAQDWQREDCHTFAMEIKGLPDDHGVSEHLLVCINASDHDARFQLPNGIKKSGWQLMLDTRYEKVSEIPQVCVSKAFLQAGKSIVLFKHCGF